MSIRLCGRFRRYASPLVIFATITILISFQPSLSYAQGDGLPTYPGITPVRPLFDLPLIAPSGWPNQLLPLSGTCQAPLRPIRNCNYFKLVYANSTNGEPFTAAPNPITLRASLIVLRPGKPASIHRVTFNGGNPEVILTPETAIVSDRISEYWNVSENAKAYVRTFVRLPSPTAKVPCFNYISPLTGDAAKWVTSSTQPQDLTMAPWPEPAFDTAARQQSAFYQQSPVYPVAIIGDADPTLPSVAIIGSSSSATLDSFIPVALNELNIPYVILSKWGWSAHYYEQTRLRARVDASCTHIINQFGRNDLGADFSPTIGEAWYLDPIKNSLKRIWARQKMQGAWVAQTTIQPRVNFPTDYTDPTKQIPTVVEQPLRQPLNDWIRLQPGLSNAPVDYIYEMADSVEYFENGVRTNRWNYAINKGGTRIPITEDGLHLNINGVNVLKPLFNASQFTYDRRDWIAPSLASAIVPKAGNALVLSFNEAKSPPLRGIGASSGFTVTVNTIPRTVYGIQQTGPKEVTLLLTGIPIRAGDQVRVGYEPTVGSLITDSAPQANALAAFAGEPVWNNSDIIAAESLPILSVSGISVRRINGQLEITLSFLNQGGGMASGVELSAATITNMATSKTLVTSTPLPLAVGDIAPQATRRASLLMTNQPSGSRLLLQFVVSHTQGSKTYYDRAIVP